MATRYEAFTVSTPIDRAIDRYTSKVGVRPTKVILPEEVDIADSAGLELLRSGRVSCMMLTHEVIDLPTSPQPRVKPRDKSFVPSRNSGLRHDIDDGSEDGYFFDVLRPYNQLGFYPGWQQGIDPPYWQSLRRYIFSRDDCTCANCGCRFKMKNLVAHHVIAKEEGGADSARNLMTLCVPCHDKMHDYHDRLVQQGKLLPDDPINTIDELIDKAGVEQDTVSWE